MESENGSEDNDKGVNMDETWLKKSLNLVAQKLHNVFHVNQYQIQVMEYINI
jgi:hypothetical protein